MVVQGQSKEAVRAAVGLLELHAQPGLASKLAAAQAEAVVAVEGTTLQDVTTGQPQPGDFEAAAWAAAALRRQVTQVSSHLQTYAWAAEQPGLAGELM